MAAPDLLGLGERLRERRTRFAAEIAGVRRERAATDAARAEKQQAEIARRQMAARNVFAGAAFGRLHNDWVMGPLSADAALLGDLQTLRDRCRELARDNPLARRYLRLCVANIVGPKGMRLIPQVPQLDGTGFDDAVNPKITRAWLRWCRRENASASRRLSFLQLERQAVRTWKSEGEYLAQIVIGADNPFGFALQPLDNDQLDHTLNRAPAPGVNEIRMGVEINRWGMPVGYWIWTAHPTDRSRDRRRERIPAERIIHVYDEERPNQTRAASSLASVLGKLKMSDAIDEALLVLLRTAASKMAFWEQTVEDADIDDDEDGSADGDVETGATFDPNAPLPMDATPGTIERVPYGWKLKPWDPGQPTAEYQPFTKRVDRNVAAGLDIAYGSLTGDLSEANYGSLRVGMLTERDGWETDQELVISLFHERVYRAWLPMALMSGQLALPYDTDRYLAPEAYRVQPRGFDWIDPSKDIDAALREVAAGLNTLTNLAAERGRDFAELVRQRAEEMRIAQDAGVTITLLPKAAAPTPSPKAEGASDE